MTEPTYQITPEQQAILDANPYYHAVSFQDDGDLLVCEDSPYTPAGESTVIHQMWGCWILDRDGVMRTVENHYHLFHMWLTEHPGRAAAAPEPEPEPGIPAIIDANEASQYLLLKYRVDVSSRTVRNWMTDGRLAGGQLGSAERAPWYTTRAAIDAVARRDWFPAPLPEPTPAELAAQLTARAAAASKRFAANVNAGQEALDDLEADARLGHLMADVDDQDLDAEAQHDEWLANLEAGPDQLPEEDDHGLAEDAAGPPAEA